jgi:hypothetical protein
MRRERLKVLQYPTARSPQRAGDGLSMLVPGDSFALTEPVPVERTSPRPPEAPASKTPAGGVHV